MSESLNVIEILEFDYRALNRYAMGYSWKILKLHEYGTPIIDRSPFSSIYDKIRDHCWNSHTHKTFIWSMNIMEFIAKFGWDELIKYTKVYPEWYVEHMTFCGEHTFE